MLRAMLVLILTLIPLLPARAAAPPAWGSLDGLATGRAVPGPAGWLNWCLADLARCRPAAPERLPAATPDLLALLERVQGEVNAAIAPRQEPAGRDLWQAGAPSGDCEDYALTKRQRLLAAGLPGAALHLATVLLPHGERHAVLAVDTDQGTLVLDNLRPRIVPLRDLPYAWLGAQGADETLLWRELAGAARSPVPGGLAQGGTDGRARRAATGTVAQ